MYALLGLGFIEEAAAFGGWLRDRADHWAGDIGRPLKIMYRVDGSSDLAEETLDHFEGWRGSRPVRIGNGAADQLQLDIYGEAMDAMYLADTHGVQAAHQGWRDIARMIDWVCDNWDQPDEGIWETRNGLAGDEGTFSLCTFWYVEALARAVRLEEARLTFEKMHTYANHLGLYSEEIGSTGEQLGNFPQAFSRLALISAAVNLDYQLGHGAGTAGPVLSRAR